MPNDLDVSKRNALAAPRAPVKNSHYSIHEGHQGCEDCFPLRLYNFVAFVSFVNSGYLTDVLGQNTTKRALFTGCFETFLDR
jgi:hypothetical protein